MHDLALFRHPDHRRRDVVGVRARVGEGPLATGHDLPAGRLRRLDRGDEGVMGLLVDEGTDQGGAFHRVADRQLLVRGGDALGDLVDDRLMGDDAAHRGASLPGRARSREDDASGRQVEVCARGDDRGVVAAELEQAASEPFGQTWADRAAHPRRAGRTDERHRAVADERLTDLRAADDHLTQVGGVSTLGQGALQQGVRGQGAQWRGL